MSGNGLASRGYVTRLSAGSGGGSALTIDPDLIEQTARIGRAYDFHDAFDEITFVINDHATLIPSVAIDPDILDQDSDIGVAKIVFDALVTTFGVLNTHAAAIGGGATTLDLDMLRQTATVGRAATLRAGVTAVLLCINNHAALISGGATRTSAGNGLSTNGYV